jgi:hypothetical protein
MQAEVLAQHAELEAAMARNKKTENGKFANQWKSIALSLMKETRLAKVSVFVATLR